MSRGGGGGRATPGRQYVVREDRTLEDVGVEVYGKSGQGPIIWGANPPRKTGKAKKGEVLIIPGRKPDLKLTGKQPTDITALLGDMEVPLMSGKIHRTMDTGTDGWVGRIAWRPGADPKLDKIIRPFGYPRAALYIGNDLAVSGCLYGVSPEMTDRGMTKTLTGYSFTADAVDSSLMPPYERNGITLKQLASELAGYFGIKAVFESDFGGPFARTTGQEGEKVFEHLAKLAAQRGGLVSCTAEGDFLFLKARTTGKPVGTIEEGGPFATGWKADYDGRKLYHAYKLITAGVKGREKAPVVWGNNAAAGKVGPSTVTEIDKLVPRSRFLTFRADDVTPGNIKDAARWKRTKQFVEALTLPFPVSGWYAPNGTRWEVNTLVTIVSATLGVPKGFTFLIRQVEFEWEAKRRSAILHLTPPQAYTGRDLEDIWT